MGARVSAVNGQFPGRFNDKLTQIVADCAAFLEQRRGKDEMQNRQTPTRDVGENKWRRCVLNSFDREEKLC
jgi:hypothetical protein